MTAFFALDLRRLQRLTRAFAAADLSEDRSFVRVCPRAGCVWRRFETSGDPRGSPRAKQVCGAIQQRTSPFFAKNVLNSQALTRALAAANFAHNRSFTCPGPMALFCARLNASNMQRSGPGTKIFLRGIWQC